MQEPARVQIVNGAVNGDVAAGRAGVAQASPTSDGGTNGWAASSPEVLTAAEVTRLLNACSGRAATGLRNRALIAVLYRGGLRVSEAIALAPGDVDPTSRTLRVGRRRGLPALSVDPGSFSVVETWLRRRRERGLPDDAPLFCTLKGEPLKPSYIRALLPRLARKAGIPKRVSAEILRRTLALELAREGVPVGLIQAHLGHSSPVTTARFLARVDPGVVVEALQRRTTWLP